MAPDGVASSFKRGQPPPLPHVEPHAQYHAQHQSQAQSQGHPATNGYDPHVSCQPYYPGFNAGAAMNPEPFRHGQPQQGMPGQPWQGSWGMAKHDQRSQYTGGPPGHPSIIAFSQQHQQAMYRHEQPQQGMPGQPLQGGWGAVPYGQHGQYLGQPRFAPMVASPTHAYHTHTQHGPSMPANNYASTSTDCNALPPHLAPRSASHGSASYPYPAQRPKDKRARSNTVQIPVQLAPSMAPPQPQATGSIHRPGPQRRASHHDSPMRHVGPPPGFAAHVQHPEPSGGHAPGAWLPHQPPAAMEHFPPMPPGRNGTVTNHGQAGRRASLALPPIQQGIPATEPMARVEHAAPGHAPVGPGFLTPQHAAHGETQRTHLKPSRRNASEDEARMPSGHPYDPAQRRKKSLGNDEGRDKHAPKCSHAAAANDAARAASSRTIGGSSEKGMPQADKPAMVAQAASDPKDDTRSRPLPNSAGQPLSSAPPQYHGKQPLLGDFAAGRTPEQAATEPGSYKLGVFIHAVGDGATVERGVVSNGHVTGDGADNGRDNQHPANNSAMDTARHHTARTYLAAGDGNADINVTNPIPPKSLTTPPLSHETSGRTVQPFASRDVNVSPAQAATSSDTAAPLPVPLPPPQDLHEAPLPPGIEHAEPPLPDTMSAALAVNAFQPPLVATPDNATAEPSDDLEALLRDAGMAWALTESAITAQLPPSIEALPSLMMEPQRMDHAASGALDNATAGNGMDIPQLTSLHTTPFYKRGDVHLDMAYRATGWHHRSWGTQVVDPSAGPSNVHGATVTAAAASAPGPISPLKITGGADIGESITLLAHLHPIQPSRSEFMPRFGAHATWAPPPHPSRGSAQAAHPAVPGSTAVNSLNDAAGAHSFALFEPSKPDEPEIIEHAQPEDAAHWATTTLPAPPTLPHPEPQMSYAFPTEQHPAATPQHAMPQHAAPQNDTPTRVVPPHHAPSLEHAFAGPPQPWPYPFTAPAQRAQQDLLGQLAMQTQRAQQQTQPTQVHHAQLQELHRREQLQQYQQLQRAPQQAPYLHPQPSFPTALPAYYQPQPVYNHEPQAVNMPEGRAYIPKSHEVVEAKPEAVFYQDVRQGDCVLWSQRWLDAAYLGANYTAEGLKNILRRENLAFSDPKATLVKKVQRFASEKLAKWRERGEEPHVEPPVNPPKNHGRHAPSTHWPHSGQMQPVTSVPSIFEHLQAKGVSTEDAARTLAIETGKNQDLYAAHFIHMTSGGDTALSGITGPAPAYRSPIVDLTASPPPRRSIHDHVRITSAPDTHAQAAKKKRRMSDERPEPAQRRRLPESGPSTERAGPSASYEQVNWPPAHSLPPATAMQSTPSLELPFGASGDSSLFQPTPSPPTDSALATPIPQDQFFHSFTDEGWPTFKDKPLEHVYYPRALPFIQFLVKAGHNNAPKLLTIAQQKIAAFNLQTQSLIPQATQTQVVHNGKKRKMDTDLEDLEEAAKRIRTSPLHAGPADLASAHSLPANPRGSGRASAAAVAAAASSWHSTVPLAATNLSHLALPGMLGPQTHGSKGYSAHTAATVASVDIHAARQAIVAGIRKAAPDADFQAWPVSTEPTPVAAPPAEPTPVAAPPEPTPVVAPQAALTPFIAPQAAGEEAALDPILISLAADEDEEIDWASLYGDVDDGNDANANEARDVPSTGEEQPAPDSGEDSNEMDVPSIGEAQPALDLDFNLLAGDLLVPGPDDVANAAADPSDPAYAWFNDLSHEDIQALLSELAVPM